MSDQEAQLTRLFRYWKKRKVELRPPASEEAIRAFETKFRVAIPGDFRLYLRTADGMKLHTDDDTGLMFSFWQLERIVPIQTLIRTTNKNYKVGSIDSASYFCFADYMIEAEIFTIRLSNDANHPNLVVGWEGAKKAESFLDFVTKYLDDPNAVISR